MKSPNDSDNQLKQIVKEITAGGVVYRWLNGKLQLLVLQDAKGRWALPKGHVEPNETYQQTALREIKEETGLTDLMVYQSVGKVDFQYRRHNQLILMTLHLFLVEARSKTNNIKKEKWSQAIAWVSPNQAIDLIEYEDICRIILIALSHIRKKNNAAV